MKIRVDQFGGPSHTFESIAEYEQFLVYTDEELVHLQEAVQVTEPDEDAAAIAAELEAMWDRIPEDVPEPLTPLTDPNNAKFEFVEGDDDDA